MTASNHWPNFIVIGPGKSGTSWLYHVLDHHPQVCMSSAKETLYFEDYYKKGPKWYAKFFKSCSNPQSDHAIGEISNTYIFSSEAAQRIAADFPQMKIVATLRDPAERAFSHYLFLKRNGELSGSFSEALRQRPDLQTRGNYFHHLSAYRERFPPEQLAIFVYDDLLKSAREYAERLFGFLHVGPIPDPTILDSKVLEAGVARNRWLARSVVGAAGLVRSAGFPDVVTRIKRGWFTKLIFRPFQSSEKPKLDGTTRSALNAYYRDEVKNLSQWLERDLVSLWLDKKTP